MRVLRSFARSPLARAACRLSGPTAGSFATRVGRCRWGVGPFLVGPFLVGAVLVGAFLGGCKGPGWHLETNEADAAIYLDGRYVGIGHADVGYRFYGASSMTAVPARGSVRDDVRAPVTTTVRLDPPAPRWLFPFDFVLEALRRGFATATPAEAILTLPAPETTLSPGTRPAQAEDLRARAAAAEKER